MMDRIVDSAKRLEELQRVFSGMEEDARAVVCPMLEEVAFLEEKLRQLRRLPHLEIDGARSGRQRITPAAKMYKETLQQYNSLMKTLLSAMGRNTPEEELPFRSLLKQYDVRE